MDILQGLISEREFMDMSDSTVEAFARLLDDKLSMRIFAYYNNEGADAEVKQRIDAKLMPTIERMLFNKAVEERGLVELVTRISLDELKYLNIDRAKAVRDLEWLSANKDKLKAYIEPRRKEDFEAFLEDLSKPIRIKVKQNIEMFYNRYERSRRTGVGSLITQSVTWEMALKGLKYLAYLESIGIHTSYLGKEF
jgi:hypothetical protein